MTYYPNNESQADTYRPSKKVPKWAKHVDVIIKTIQDGSSILPTSTTELWGRNGID